MSILPFWVFDFTNPISFLLYFIFFEIIYRIITPILKKRWRAGFVIRLTIYIIILLISTIFNYQILFTNDSRLSPVDVTPLARLNHEQIENLENILYTFENQGRFTITEPPRDFSSSVNKIYYFYWSRELHQYGVQVTVRLYDDKEAAANAFVFERHMMERFFEYTTHRFPNGIAILLSNSRMFRNHGMPVSGRSFNTSILMENAIISLRDYRPQHRLYPNGSSLFITELHRLLRDYAAL